MSISLKKGQNIDLTKGRAGLNKVLIGLGWDETEFGDDDVDLDASVFLLNSLGKCRQESDFIFYNNLESDGVTHTGDNKTGSSDNGDDEIIHVDLAKIPSAIHRIVIVVTIFEAEERSQRFGQVTKAYIRIADQESGDELARFDLGEDFSVEDGVITGELYRHNGEWKFKALGTGYNKGLLGMHREYGLV